MSFTLRDRLRQFVGPIGAKRISLEAILPMMLLPAMLCIAAINFYCTIIVCLALPLLLGYAQYVRRNYLPRTKFFFMWAFWSIAYLSILFEMTVPLTELMPEENFIFIATMFGSIICFYKVRSNSNESFESLTDIIMIMRLYYNISSHNIATASDQNKGIVELCSLEYRR